MTGQTTAAIYCRISRDAEGDQLGVQRQETLCRKLAESRELSIIEIYTDNDVGASDETGNKPRTNYTRMLKDARAGKFQYILAYSTSRLTRRITEFEELIKLYDEHGIQYRMVDSGNVDLETPHGIFIARTLANAAALESGQISARQKAAFQQSRFAGKAKRHRQRPFGYEDDAVTIRETEAEQIREAVEEIKQGASITAICREWEKAGIKTAAGKAEWQWAPMKRMLLGWRNVGIRTYRQQVPDPKNHSKKIRKDMPLVNEDGSYVKAEWDAIISLEDREDALAMLQKRSLEKTREGKWLLSGLVRCAECGTKMYGQLTGTPTYSCKNGGHNAITAERLEQWVEAEVTSRIANRMQKRAEQGSADKSVEPEEWPKQNELADVTSRISELMEAYTDRQLSGDVVFAQVNRLEDKQKTLRNERERFYAQQIQPSTQYADFDEVMDWVLDNVASQTTDNDQKFNLKKRHIKREVDTVIVKKGERGRAGWGMATFDRIEILWNEQVGT